MKYQKLENQEAHWKWLYLVKKHRNEEKITKYQEKSLEQAKAQELLNARNEIEHIENWVKDHLSPDLVIKLDQAIRARRKRFFNAEKQMTKKKSIDLEYTVWLQLSKFSKQKNMTLSESIAFLIEEQQTK